MDADFKELFRDIGELKALAQNNVATQHALDSKCSRLFKKVDEIREEQIEERGKVKLLAEQSATHTAAAAAAHAQIAAVTKKIEAYENKGRGVRVGLALAGATGGGGLIMGIIQWFKSAATVATQIPTPPQ